MPEENTSPTKESHRVPSWAWPYIFGIFMLGYPVLFYDNRTLRAEIKEANERLFKAKDEELARKDKDNSSIRRQNEFLTRLLYTSENISKFLYTDSIAVANRTAAEGQQGAGESTGERAN